MVVKIEANETAGESIAGCRRPEQSYRVEAASLCRATQAVRRPLVVSELDIGVENPMSRG